MTIDVVIDSVVNNNLETKGCTLIVKALETNSTLEEL